MGDKYKEAVTALNNLPRIEGNTKDGFRWTLPQGRVPDDVAKDMHPLAKRKLEKPFSAPMRYDRSKPEPTFWDNYHDGILATGRGFWNGATAVNNLAGGLAKDIGHLAVNVPRYTAYPFLALKDKIWGTDSLPRWNKAVDAAGESIDNAVDSYTNYVNELNDVVQTELPYRNPGNSAIKHSKRLGTVAAASMAGAGAGKLGVYKLLNPVSSSRVASVYSSPLAQRVAGGVLGKPGLNLLGLGAKYAGWMSKHPGIEAALNMLPFAVKGADYVTGATHINPDDPEWLRKVKKHGPDVAEGLYSYLSPAGWLNLQARKGWITHNQEATARAAMAALPHADVIDGSILESLYKHREDAKEYTKANIEELTNLDYGIPAILDNSRDNVGRLMGLRNMLNYTSGNKWLRWFGAQPTLATPPNLKSSGLLKAYEQNLKRPAFRKFIAGPFAEGEIGRAHV